MRDRLVELGWDSKTALKVKDVHKGCMFLDQTRGIVYIGEIMEMAQPEDEVESEESEEVKEEV